MDAYFKKCIDKTNRYFINLCIKKNLIHQLSFNKTLPLKYFLKHLPWNWNAICENPNITIKNILNLAKEKDLGRFLKKARKNPLWVESVFSAQFFI